MGHRNLCGGCCHHVPHSISCVSAKGQEAAVVHDCQGWCARPMLCHCRVLMVVCLACANRFAWSGRHALGTVARHSGLCPCVPAAVSDEILGVCGGCLPRDCSAAVIPVVSPSVLVSQKPIGAVRFNLQAPTANTCQPTSAYPPCSYNFSNVTTLVRATTV